LLVRARRLVCASPPCRACEEGVVIEDGAAPLRSAVFGPAAQLRARREWERKVSAAEWGSRILGAGSQP